MHKLLLLLALLAGLNFINSDANASLCDQEQDLKSLAVLNKGRIKPLIVAANESTKIVSGKKSINNFSSIAIFCNLSLKSLNIQSDLDLPIRIDHVDVKKLLKLKDNEHSISALKAREFKEMIRSDIMRIKESTSYKKALNRLWFKIDTFDKASAGELWTTYQGGKWLSLNEAFTQNDISAEKLQANSDSFVSNNDNSINTELLYTKLNIFSIAMILALIAIFVTVLVKNITVGYIFSWIVVLTEVAGMTFRVLISGRAPITNMYETVLFSGFGALVIALIIYIFKKDKIFILGGLGYNILCLFMMRFADGMLTESISPLVPVLRDNFWLSTHVTTIILSYAALALSWILANIVLFKQRFSTIEKKNYRYYEGLVYTATKVGIVLLAAGIILGGVWADYSWGRFWGWDPKETWSLIVLLFYIAVLHGKNTTWISTHRFVVLCSLGFMTVMMAWFGVNYILASGLHSYGFSEGGAIFLGTFFVSQIVFTALTGYRKNEKA
jgi:cytochrome c-type biogenesis protein CcsB